MFGRTLVLAVAACGVAAALVEATWAEGGALVWLDDAAHQGVVAAQPFTSTDCLILGSCPNFTGGPPGFGAPCSNPGGFCSTPYCADSTPSYTCQTVKTYNPFDWACVMTGTFACESDILTCEPSPGGPACIGRGNGKGPNPTRCGNRTTCLY